MPDKTTDTQSVLDQLVKGVTDRKPGNLTPIGEEAKGPAYADGTAIKPPLFGTEAAALLTAVRGIEDQLMFMLSITGSIQKALTEEALSGKTPTIGASKQVMHVTDKQVADHVPLVKDDTIEAGTVRDFPAEFAAKSAAAQAATFTNTDAKAEGLWLCPTHGSGVERTSRSGRKFRVCEKCDQFERLPKAQKGAL